MPTKPELDGTSPKRCLQTYAQVHTPRGSGTVPTKPGFDRTSPKRCLQTYAPWELGSCVQVLMPRGSGTDRAKAEVDYSKQPLGA